MTFVFDKKNLFEHLENFWFAPSDALLRSVEKVIWDQFSFSKPVLDIGTGDGRHSRLLFSGRKIDLGVDSDPKAVKKAKSCGVYQKVIKANANKLPLPDSSFETVVSNSTFEHMTNDLKSVKEVFRVLKKKGKFYFSVPTPRFKSCLHKMGVSKEKLSRYDKRVLHFHYRGLEDWRKILSKYGLKIIYSQYYFSPAILKLWYRLFRISVFKPFHRELWSYLKDSPYGKLAPKKLIVNILKLATLKAFGNSIGKDGTWVFIIAQKQ